MLAWLGGLSEQPVMSRGYGANKRGWLIGRSEKHFGNIFSGTASIPGAPLGSLLLVSCLLGLRAAARLLECLAAAARVLPLVPCVVLAGQGCRLTRLAQSCIVPGASGGVLFYNWPSLGRPACLPALPGPDLGSICASTASFF